MDKIEIAKAFVSEVNTEYKNLDHDKIYYLFIDKDYNLQMKESLFMVKEQPHILGVMWRYRLIAKDTYWGEYPTYAYKTMFISDSGCTTYLKVDNVSLNISDEYFYRVGKSSYNVMITLKNDYFELYTNLSYVAYKTPDFIIRAIANAKKFATCKSQEEAEIIKNEKWN